ncbi:anthranilate synthase component I [Porticoccaceae bacterium]|nr:anthranilate synthase component I [Porticoccaceae bacterium]MDA8681617.1 anthranilate synthase component I [Porticoccaceae bacterium]MDB2634199.1 anthranilate synthase component I [Porticoccaceae bacterium]MDB2664129.1 anthranilate synthase component I [Porticoccaceae bacterium]
MNKQQFADLAKQNYNRIPITREVLADLETPLSVYLKLALGSNSYLFESVQGGEKWGRYSLIGLQSSTVLKLFGHRLEIIRDGKPMVNRHTSDPLAEVERFRELFSMPDLPELPRFTGGLVGYFGYDSVRYVEPKLANSAPPDVLNTPDVLLMASDEVAIFDNLSGTIMLVVHVDAKDPDAWNCAQKRLDELEEKLAQPIPKLPVINRDKALTESDFVSSFGKDNYKAAVQKIKQYTLSGDIMQVVPSQRFTAPFDQQPINLYRALRRLNPSPYMYFLDLDGFHIVGSSPEVLARLEDQQVTVRPIAGTRRRGETELDDKQLEEEMLADPKEIAEHLMLIDLGRNDVGRISHTGSVEVTEKMVVERYSHVMHITSNVVGKVQDNMSAIDVLKATLPAGTLSGAPKIRAMEIIDEVEPVKRNIYGGAVGYIGWNGNMDMAIAIRTAVIKDGQLHVQSGGGVVADSVPELEWEETMNKARAVMRAAAMASGVAK